MTFEKIYLLVIDWAKERNLYEESIVQDHGLKFMEEFGELCRAILHKDIDKQKDAIGDMLVVLTNMCYKLKLNPVKCFEIAYNEIKNRKGKMINGTFVKEEDLKNMNFEINKNNEWVKNNDT